MISKLVLIGKFGAKTIPEQNVLKIFYEQNVIFYEQDVMFYEQNVMFYEQDVLKLTLSTLVNKGTWIINVI